MKIIKTKDDILNLKYWENFLIQDNRTNRLHVVYLQPYCNPADFEGNYMLNRFYIMGTNGYGANNRKYIIRSDMSASYGFYFNLTELVDCFENRILDVWV